MIQSEEKDLKKTIKEFNTAIKLFSKKKYTEARDAFDKIFQKDSSFFTLYLKNFRSGRSDIDLLDFIV